VHRALLLLAPLTAVTLLAACGSDTSSSDSPTTSPATTTATTTAPATTKAPATTAGPTTTAAPAGEAEQLQLSDSSLGPILTDGEGMSVYLFTKDTQGSGTSVCTGDCAVAWPAVVTVGAPVAGKGVDAAKLGTITRDDGATQVSYDGWPLYYFANDATAGDVNGQGVGGVWFAVKADGTAVS
jgi:predicted lipoprotein with Yx(FWY)xxD motif